MLSVVQEVEQQFQQDCLPNRDRLDTGEYFWQNCVPEQFDDESGKRKISYTQQKQLHENCLLVSVCILEVLSGKSVQQCR